jgi:hypothetical protein
LCKHDKLETINSKLFKKFLIDSRFEVIKFVYILILTLNLSYYSPVFIQHILSDDDYVYAFNHLNNLDHLRVSQKFISNLTTRLDSYSYALPILQKLLANLEGVQMLFD